MTTYQNPFADMMKNFSEYKAPSFSLPQLDVTQWMTSGRKNAEACSAAGQAISESCQAITRRQAELARAHVEKTLKAAKDMLVNGSPEINTTNQVELAKNTFEASLNYVREVSELCTKSGFEVFGVLSNRASQCVDECTGAVTSTTASKRKAA